MHTSMEWLSSVLMALSAGYTLVYSHTLPITPKSEDIELLCLFLFTNPFTRVLLATIRDRGLCPCPRCLVPKSRLDCLGLARDKAIRSKLREFTKDRVLLARRVIYELGNSITGVRVEDLLKDISAVPTLVRNMYPSV